MSLACFSILLLVLFFFTITSSATDGYAKSQSYKNEPLSSNLSTFFHDKGGSRQNVGEDGGEAVLGDDKRKVYTGPNPLHNR